MNGFRRILGGGSQTPPRSAASPPPTMPLAVSGKPSWPPDQSQSFESSSKTTITQGLFLRKQKPTPVSPTSDARPPSNGSSVTSPARKSSMSSPVAGPSSPGAFSASLPTSQNGQLNMRDELLISLLTSEAVVDSRDCEILGAEEIEELKKVRLQWHYYIFLLI